MQYYRCSYCAKEYKNKVWYNKHRIICIPLEKLTNESREQDKINKYNSMKDKSIIEYIKDDWTYIQCIPIEKFNKQLGLEIVNVSGNYYKYLPEYLKQDIDIIITSLNNEENVIRYITSYLDNNKLSIDIIKQIVNKNGNLLRFIDFEYRDNYEIVEIAINNTGNAWFYISDKLKYNVKLLKLAITKTPSIIQNLMQNKEIFNMFREEILQSLFIKDRKIIEDECIICYETKTLFNLECHKLHNLCINCMKLMTYKKCPLCRKHFTLPKSIDIKIWK